MRPVVVTRPQAQAASLANQIAALGRPVHLFPLLAILPIADTTELDRALSQLDQFSLVAFVSPNAIDAVFTRLSTWPQDLPIAVMGEGSRQALAEHGITDRNARIIRPTEASRTDSQTLLAELDLAALRDTKVLIVRGESGRELLADALRMQGVEVVPVAAYRRIAPDFTAETGAELSQLIALNADWLITSSEALRILLEWAKIGGGVAAVEKIQRQHLIVPHIRIAEMAQTLGFHHITQSASGDAGLLVALQLQL